jgi:transposase
VQSASARARCRLHLVRQRSSLKQRGHALLLAHSKPCPVSDLFGVRGRQLLARLARPEPWHGTIEASLRLIDELEREIINYGRELRRLGADHRYVPLLCTVPGISGCSPTRSLLRSATSTASPLRASSPATAVFARASTSPASAICVGRSQSRPALPTLGARRGSHPCLHSAVRRERYQHTKARIGKQRGAKVAQVDLARRLAEAIWHMLIREQPLAPKGATEPWPPDGPKGDAPPERTPIGLVLPIEEAIER